METDRLIELMRLKLIKSKPRNRQLFLTDFFRSIDKDYSKKIDLDEFKYGLVKLELENISHADIELLFRRFDVKKNGKIDYADFVRVLRPDMNETRYKIVNRAFDKLDVNRDGVLSIEDFRHVYLEQAKNHPNVKEGKWTIEQVVYIN